MEIRILADNIRIKTMTTSKLRETFLVEKLFEKGQLNMIYSDTERAVIAGAIPPIRNWISE